MNKISNNETNVNLRYDGYYLWLDYPRSPKWLQFYPNGIVGYGVRLIEEIGGLEYYDYTPSIDELSHTLHLYIFENKPESKDSLKQGFYHWGTYQIEGNIIKIQFKIVHQEYNFEGRILIDSLDLIRESKFDGVFRPSQMILFEFVVFSTHTVL